MPSGTAAEWFSGGATLFVGVVALLQTHRIRTGETERQRKESIRQLVFRAEEMDDQGGRPCGVVRILNASSVPVFDVAFADGHYDNQTGEIEESTRRYGVINAGAEVVLKMPHDIWMMVGPPDELSVLDAFGRRWTKSLSGEVTFVDSAEPQNRPWWKFWGSKKAKQ